MPKKIDKEKIAEYSELLWQMHVCVTGFYNEYAKSYNLTLAELKVLTYLYKKETSTQKSITQYTYLPKQTVNAIIKGFLSKGIIDEPKESNSDKRNKVICLNAEGIKFTKKVISKAKDIEIKALASLGEDNVRMLIEHITKYKNNLTME